MTNPGDPDIVGMVRSLTKAQREALVGSFVVEGQASYRNGRLACRAHGTTLWNLKRAALLNDYRGTPLLTEAGLRVRAHLLDNPS